MSTDTAPQVALHDLRADLARVNARLEAFDRLAKQDINVALSEAWKRGVTAAQIRHAYLQRELDERAPART